MLQLFFCLVWLVTCLLMNACSGVGGAGARILEGAGHGVVDAHTSEGFRGGAGRTESEGLAKTQKVIPGQITGVDIERLFSLMQSQQVLLVDCRPGIYYHLGHIQDAMHLPLKKYARSLDTTKGLFDRALKEGKVIVIYCQNLNCPDAYLFAKGISAEGYSVSVYKGGWEEWKASGL